MEVETADVNSLQLFLAFQALYTTHLLLKFPSFLVLPKYNSFVGSYFWNPITCNSKTPLQLNSVIPKFTQSIFPIFQFSAVLVHLKKFYLRSYFPKTLINGLSKFWNYTLQFTVHYYIKSSIAGSCVIL
jgi:hypothetical protein